MDSDIKKIVLTAKANARKAEDMREALTLAIDLLKKNYMIKMAAAALPDEVERAWRHYCRTTPEMAHIIAALNS
ncbi:MAG: hypothetical protein WC485_01905 [Opitutaceae bacterium]